MVDPEPAAAGSCDEPRPRQPREHATRGRADAHDPDTPAPEPRVPEPCSIPEDIARLGAERTEGEDAPSAVHDHRTPPRVPLERARVLDGPLVDDKVLRRRAPREPAPDPPPRAGRRDEGDRG